jgi:hypothetical protein
MSFGLRALGVGVLLAVAGAIFVGWRHRTSGPAPLAPGASGLEEGI